MSAVRSGTSRQFQVLQRMRHTDTGMSQFDDHGFPFKVAIVKHDLLYYSTFVGKCVSGVFDPKHADIC